MELTIENVSKTYSNGVRALDGVSLSIPTGMFGLLGPNGSGKTTLMRTIATLQDSDGGRAQLGDIDVLKDKEFLSHLAALKGITNTGERKDVVEALLHRTNLWNIRKQKLGSFSGGTKQRFGIAQALLGNPQLIIVDEPTAGLDPEERNRFLNLLSEIGENVIVILSTHIVDDVAQVCSRMAIIKEGRVLRTGEPEDAIAEIRGKVWRKVIDKSELPAYESEHDVISTRLRSGRTLLHVFADGRPDPSFDGADPDLKDVYFITLSRENGADAASGPPRARAGGEGTGPSDAGSGSSGGGAGSPGGSGNGGGTREASSVFPPNAHVSASARDTSDDGARR